MTTKKESDRFQTWIPRECGEDGWPRLIYDNEKRTAISETDFYLWKDGYQITECELYSIGWKKK